MMTNPIRQAQNKSEKGAAIVEAAIILLVFFMCVFAVFEAGRFLNYRQVLTNAAREGARFAVTPLTGTNTLPTTAEVADRVNTYLASANISAVTPEVDPVSVATGSVLTTYTRVRVEHPYSVITVPGFFDVLEVNLAGEALMRNETSN
jgi:Flp pilus assembly protein TadG